MKTMRASGAQTCRNKAAAQPNIARSRNRTKLLNGAAREAFRRRRANAASGPLSLIYGEEFGFVFCLCQGLLSRNA